ncbi:MAG: aminoglycoside phosphotransferase family protein [Candidatus Heimdallarchaeota archaeon]|nr:aminoglycoside phosphotransferase family protein [Candidatus Heimdallarchaeota archaeon]
MIEESIRNEVQDKIVEIFGESHSFTWERIKEGYTNENFKIINEQGIPLAICKVYVEDEIHSSKDRFDRELNALEIFSGILAPELVCHKNSQILVYKYIIGTELHKLPTSEINVDLLQKTITKMLSLSKLKRNSLKSDVSSFYNKLVEKYTNSGIKYPKKLTDTLQMLSHQQEEILDAYSEHLTFVHGDLIPPNFIFHEQKYTLLDWEFSRPELIFFDQQYFNYYAKAHNLPIVIEVEQNVQDFYNNLVDVLERLWRFGYEMSNKEIFYKI